MLCMLKPRGVGQFASLIWHPTDACLELQDASVFPLEGLFRQAMQFQNSKFNAAREFDAHLCLGSDSLSKYMCDWGWLTKSNGGAKIVKDFCVTHSLGQASTKDACCRRIAVALVAERAPLVSATEMA